MDFSLRIRLRGSTNHWEGKDFIYQIELKQIRDLREKFIQRLIGHHFQINSKCFKELNIKTNKQTNKNQVKVPTQTSRGKYKWINMPNL